MEKPGRKVVFAESNPMTFEVWMDNFWTNYWPGNCHVQRLGQAMMNSLPDRVHTRITNEYPHLDPFYNDAKVSDFLRFVAATWSELNKE